LGWQPYWPPFSGSPQAAHRRTASQDTKARTYDLAREEASDCRIITFANRLLAEAVSDHLPVRARFRASQEFRDRLPDGD